LWGNKKVSIITIKVIIIYSVYFNAHKVYKYIFERDIGDSMEDGIEKIKNMAIEKGANSVKIIPISDISVNDWVRQKCEFGCRQYGKRFACPPYVQPPDETRKRLNEYSKAMLIEFTDLRERGEWRQIQRNMAGLEREAFLCGLYRAFAYYAGTCRLCDVCPAESLENPSLFDKKKCVNRRIARPSMEGAGIDVFKTARNAGYQLDVVKEENTCFKSFCLLLLE